MFDTDTDGNEGCAVPPGTPEACHEYPCPDPDAPFCGYDEDCLNTYPLNPDCAPPTTPFPPTTTTTTTEPPPPDLPDTGAWTMELASLALVIVLVGIALVAYARTVRR